MSRKFVAGFALTIALLLASPKVFRGQEAPEPPDPPDPPEAPEVFVLNDGAVHLGVSLGDVTAEKAHELKLPAIAGAIVDSVQKDSSAAKAGIEAGDVILEFDGVRLRSSAELRRLIRETPAGRTVEMKIIREGKPRVLSAKMEASDNHFNYRFNMPEVIPPMKVPDIHVPPMDFSFFGDRGAMLGISADDLTPQLAEYFGVKQGKGVLISEVTKGGAADKAGLKAGDVIVQVDGKLISGVGELRSALNDNFTDDTRKVGLTIVRDRHEQTVNAELARTQTREKSTSNSGGLGSDQTLSQTLALAAQLRQLADSQRALVQDEVSKQQQNVQSEWQRQLREQMRSLKDQLEQMQTLHLVLPQDGEI